MLGTKPTLAPRDRRSAAISVMLRQSEADAIRQAAADAKMGISTFARSILLRALENKETK